MIVKLKELFKKKRGQDIVHRWAGNPLVDIGYLDFKCSDIHNAGVAFFDNQVLLLITIESLSGQRNIHIGRPAGKEYYKVDSEPFLSPSSDITYFEHEKHGVQDPRVTYLDGVYYIMYDAHGKYGTRVGLGRTTDFRDVERIGMISEPNVKGGALFPTKIKGQYARLERPAEGSSIWISYSNDLVYWGDSELVISPRPGFWDLGRIGTSAPPIEIDQGWLVFYYGVKTGASIPVCRLGTVILDKEEPTKIIGRANIPVLSPRKDYERIGDVPNIVFSTGAILEADGKLKLYYGAANSCICIGTTTVDEIVTNCFESEQEY